MNPTCKCRCKSDISNFDVSPIYIFGARTWNPLEVTGHENPSVAVPSEKKDFLCRICNGSFSRNDGLKRHISNVHDKNKLYKCSFCSLTFGQKSQLNSHVSAIHEENKPNTCKDCNAR